jgi:protein involved in polysaccharide export with SLBB domain
VFVGGEVNQPGQVDLQPGLTALGALSSRGWLKTNAASDSLLLIRAAGPGKRLVRRLDLSKENVAKNDIPLRPYDIVFVPKSSVSQVGEWVDQNINAIIPRAISFGAFYDVNNLNFK